VGPAEAISLGAIVGAGTNMLYYRFGLPLLGGGKPAHAGLWHAVLSIGDRAFIGSDVRAFVNSSVRQYGVRYNDGSQDSDFLCDEPLLHPFVLSGKTLFDPFIP